MVTVQTPRCVVCRTSAILEVDDEGYIRWQMGMYVQHAFPDMTADERELLVSGTHAHCWVKTFGRGDD